MTAIDGSNGCTAAKDWARNHRSARFAFFSSVIRINFFFDETTEILDECFYTQSRSWNASSPWQLFLSTAQIALPCLVVDGQSLTLLCNESVCELSFLNDFFYCNEFIGQAIRYEFQDSIIDQKVRACAEIYSQGLVHFLSAVSWQYKFLLWPSTILK